MSAARIPTEIHIKGAREHNLRDLEVRLPRDALTVITGVSGSGKSSLAFDTLYAEGYRKYIDSLSTRARQVLEQIKRPDVDFIHGLSPVIAIEQRTGAGANPRSTVATVTELADYARLLWAVKGQAYCPKDGGRIVRRSLDDCLARILREPEGARVMLLAPWLTARPAIIREELPRLQQRGFQRVRIDGAIRRLDEPDLVPRGKEVTVEIVIDRLKIDAGQRSRLADSLELAFREGKDRATVLVQSDGDEGWREFSVSQHLACDTCGTVYEPVTSRHFSYNHPDGACPRCGGLGEVLTFLPELVVPDPTKSVKNGAIKPWRLGSKRMIIQRNAILKQLAEQLPFDATTPWEELPAEVRETVMHGAGDRLFHFRLTGAKKSPEPQPFAGVLADLEETRRTTTSDGLRARLMAYQTRDVCPACRGARLRPESLHVFLGKETFADFMGRTVGDAAALVRELEAAQGEDKTVGEVLSGLGGRLHFLREVGLSYLGLDRAYETLSGGEAQRVRLATQLGMGLVGVAYILDEPSIGLHPVDNERLIATLEDLRDRGNAVVVVEHESAMMRRADHLLELGPGAGEEGGKLVFAGTPQAAMADPKSATGGFLSGSLKIEKNAMTLRPRGDEIVVRGARHHNLKGIEARFPVGLLTCVTGVSGSGKSTLVNDILGRAAAFRLHRARAIPGAHEALSGLEHFESAVRVDQEAIGRSPRSNPATYTKIFDGLRDLFAACPLAKVRGYTASRFSFNVTGGRCERCKGDGAIKLDMQFLTDVYAECPSCHGQRYNRETLEVRFKGYNIAEVLALSVDEAMELLRHQPKIAPRLETLQAVGLGYLRLGQAANTLSGGEAQRLKLSLELSRRQQGQTLYLLDEPTTGLHWLDIQKLMDLLLRLRDAGNTIIIIEHDLDVIRLADWVIDLGPGGGDAGGEIVCAGTVEEVMACEASPTGRCLREHVAVVAAD